MTSLRSKAPVIPLPHLVLRVAFAGNRSVPDEQLVRSSLSDIWQVLGLRLAEIAPSVPITAGREPPVSAYYSGERPRLRLITGLAEGADAMAWQTLQAVSDDASNAFAAHLQTELAAVLPCPLADYRLDRDVSHLPVFDLQVAQCSYIAELDGLMVRDGSDVSRERRARGFRAQSTVLLRQSDFLIAVADPAAAGKPGGTLETIRNALDFDIPVVFVHAVTGEIRLLDAIEDLAAAFASEPLVPWQTTLRDWITKVIADPDTVTPDAPASHGQPEKVNKGQRTLEEFFYSTMPPVDTTKARLITFYEKRWSAFARVFKSSIPQILQAETAPFKTWRTRSKELNYHYSGLYRGTFFLNAVRAVLAVTCAALTLVLLGTQHAPQVSAVKDQAEKISYVAAAPSSVEPTSEHSSVVPPPTPAQPAVAEISVHAEEPTPTPATDHSKPHDPAHSGPPVWHTLSLLALASCKLFLVFTIFKNTHNANHGGWNERAVDYRYLAERLRALYCLPLLGSYQPPAAARPQYSSRITRQSAIDWLFDAIVRSHSPAESAHVRQQTFTTSDGKDHSIHTLSIQPATGLAACAQWLDSQTAYHAKSREEMLAMHRWAEQWGAYLGKIVIAIVSFDILVLVVDVLGFLKPFPHLSHSLHAAAPWLVFLTALLPAAVAGLNAIRFQSECRRLADRSDFMVKVLTGRRAQLSRLQQTLAAAQANPATDPGSWTTEALRLAELIASDFAQEVSEWSVLYGKEVHEP